MTIGRSKGHEMTCCPQYAEAANGVPEPIYFLNKFEYTGSGYRQSSTLPPARFCPWCGAEVGERKAGAPPRCWVRGGYLYTEALDGCFHAMGDDIYLFTAGGAPRCFIHHAYRAPDAVFRELTEDERRQWDWCRSIRGRDVVVTKDWKPLPEWGR